MFSIQTQLCAFEFEALLELFAQASVRLFGKKRCNNLRFGELWFVFVGSFHVEWDYSRLSTHNLMNDVRCLKLLYRFPELPCEEDGTLSVVGVIVAQFVLSHGWTFWK